MSSIAPEPRTASPPRPVETTGPHPEPPPGGPRGASREGDQRAATAAADNLVEILAADLVAVFLVRAPDVDVVKLGLQIAEAGRRLEEQRTIA